MRSFFLTAIAILVLVATGFSAFSFLNLGQSFIVLGAEDSLARNVSVNGYVDLNFTRPLQKESVNSHLKIEPQSAQYRTEWLNNRTLRIKPLVEPRVGDWWQIYAEDGISDLLGNNLEQELNLKIRIN